MNLDLAQGLLSLLASVGSAVGVYGAIRADLATAIANAKNANESATRAHSRIDNLRGA